MISHVQAHAALFQLTGVGVVETDMATGHLVRANQTFCEMVGYSEAELRRMTNADLTHPDDWRHDAETFERLQLGEVDQAVALTRCLRKDGTVVWLELHVTIFREGNEAVNIAVVNDVTERKQSEEALRASEERFRAFVTSSSDVVYSMNADWTEMRSLVGRDFIPDTDDPNSSWLETYIHPDDQPQVLDVINEAIRTKSIFELEHRVVRVDGSLGWTHSRAIPLLGAAGDITGWFGTARDVTERKRAEQALRESEERLRLTVESVKDYAIFTLDPELRVTSWNSGAESIFGYPEEEALGRSGDILFTPEDRKAGVPEREARTAREEGRADDDRWHLRRDGSRFFASGVTTPLKEGERLTGYVKVARDLTGQQQAAAERERLLAAVQDLNETLEQRVEERTEQLRHSEQRFSQAFYANPISACMTTLGRETFVEVNDAFLTLTGYSRDEVLGRTSQVLGMWSSPEDQKKLREAQQGGVGFRNLELKLRTKAGGVRDILISAEVIRLDGHDGFLKMFYDITERKQTEEQMHRAIQEVMTDTSWFSHKIMERLANIKSGTQNFKVVDLSRREQQVLERMAGGMDNDAIAHDLGIAIQTTRNYISSIYDKIGVHSRVEAVLWARERGIVGF